MEGARETVRTLAQVGQTGGRGVLVGSIEEQEGRAGGFTEEHCSDLWI